MSDGYKTITVPLEYEAEIIQDFCLELWKDQQEPLFWFGEKLFHIKQERTGMVMGMRYVPQNLDGIMRSGWWYLINFSVETNGHWIHEDSLREK